MPRKKPFSNKQKKKQLQEKREKKRVKNLDEENKSSNGNSADTEGEEESEIGEKSLDKNTAAAIKLHYQPVSHLQDKNRKHDPNRYRLQFDRESKGEIEARKKAAQEPLKYVSEEHLEVSLETTYKPGSVLDMPKRPPWKYSMSKEQVERTEREMFENFLDKIYDEYKLSELSYFERNLETWRQLWRVLEVSDIVILITDIRHPVLHFPPTVYNHVVQDLKKELVLVLNKIDLVPPEVVTAWKQYFKSKFEHLKVVCFTSFPKDENERKKDPSKVLSKRRRRKRGFFPVGPRALLEACESLRGDKIDLSSWARRLSEQEKGEEEGILYNDYGSSDESEEEEGGSFEDVEHNENILTLGLVGHPNVGKSSLLNGLVGHKVVSTSRTPGHTKHFQTIFLTANVRLCDCPGLVFPSVVGKQLQILSGMYPISQVQEPYTAVGYLAARVPLVDLLQLVHPLNRADSDDEGGTTGDQNHPWSAWDVCDAWAHKRGFLTAKAGRTDVYRAANSLLRLAVDGKIVMCVYPPGFISKRAEWQDHPETKEITVLQERHSESRRLRQQENEADEFSSHLLAPPGMSKRDERPSSDGDDEQEGEETDVVSSNPFALLSDE